MHGKIKAPVLFFVCFFFFLQFLPDSQRYTFLKHVPFYIFSTKAWPHTPRTFFSGELAITQQQSTKPQCHAYNAMWDTASSGNHHCQTVRFVCFILSRCFRFLKINYKSKQHDSLSTEQIVLPGFCRMHPMQGSRQTLILMATAQVKKKNAFT